MPASETVNSWAESTPPEFMFCIKMPRDVTHGPTPPGSLASPEGPPPGHLRKPETIDIARRLLDAAAELGGKLGAVLLQFPPRFPPDRLDELAAFLAALRSPIPLVAEFRHRGWINHATRAVLAANAAQLVATDESPWEEIESEPRPGRRATLPTGERSDLLYMRFLGRHSQFPDRTRERIDPTARLGWWRDALRDAAARAGARSIFCFFDNDFAGHAPYTAQRFKGIIGLGGGRVEVVEAEQPGLFG